jgi:outer membrane protein assembly factor BamB
MTVVRILGLLTLGAFAHVAQGAPPTAAGSTAAGVKPPEDIRPAPGSLQRPKRLWLHESVRAPGADGVATDGQSLFVLRSDRQQVVAFIAATGREVWAAKAASQPRDSWPRSQLAVSGGIVIVRGSDEQLTGFAAASGKQLWTRKEPCDIETAVGQWAVLRCHGSAKRADGSLHIVEMKSGRESRSISLDWLGESGLSDRALFTWTKRERLLRKTPLVAGESRWDVPLDATFIEDILPGTDVVICAGREIRAFDAATGKLLWSKRPVADHRGLAIRPALQARQVYLGMTDAIVAFDERSGQERRRYPLPGFLQPQPDDHQFNELFVSAERVLIVNDPAQVAGHAIMATWAAPGETPKLIARPIALGWKPLLVGNILVALVDYDGFAAGYSLADLQPALASLARPDAIRAVDTEVAPAPRLRSFVLDQIPGEAAPAREPQRPDDAVKLGVCKATVRKVQDLQSGSPAGIFGTVHPINVEAAAPDGRWVAVCQARNDTNGDGAIDVMFGHHGEAFGDAMTPYLVVGGGPGHRFDELIGHSPGGRYVGIREGACLNLVDTVDGTATTLADADLRDPQPALGPHRGLSFDGIDKRVLFLRASAGGDRVVVRELKTGHETEIDPGPGVVVRAVLDPEGESVLIDVATGNHLPRLITSLAPRSCRGQALSYSVFGSDEAPSLIVRRIASASGGRAHDVPGLIRSFGQDLLIRADDRSLVVVDPQGRRQTIVPAACNATVSHIDASRHVVAFSCESEADEHGIAPVSIYRDGTTTKLRAIDRVEQSDDWTQTMGRYVPIYDSVIDLDKPSERPPLSAFAGLRPHGVFIRSDGRELRPLKSSERSSLGRADVGPLQWVAGTK